MHCGQSLTAKPATGSSPPGLQHTPLYTSLSTHTHISTASVSTHTPEKSIMRLAPVQKRTLARVLE